MPQVLKEEVQKRIVQAALRVFAEKGFGAATIGEIATAAGVSTGNIYRYYEGKGALFDDAVDESFVRRFTMLLQDRVRALAGVEDVRQLDPDAPWYLASEELLRFSIENRFRMVILLGRAEGTRWESFARETVYNLVRLALTHFRALNPGLKIGETTHFVLVRIYENLLATNARILAEHDDEPRIRQAVATYSRYHLAGLQAVFDGDDTD
jgi:AcrR family transcriptional regulator